VEGDNTKEILDLQPAIARTYSGEEMEDRIRGLDWSKTPMGPIHTWPQSLRTVVNILLSRAFKV
jgi:hypothetical protein